MAEFPDIQSLQNEIETNLDKVLHPEQSIFGMQIIRINQDDSGNFRLGHANDEYMTLLRKFDSLNISDSPKDNILIKEMIAFASNLGVEQILTYLVLLNEMSSQFKLLFKKQLHQIKVSISTRLSAALKSFESFGFFDQKSTSSHPLARKKVLLVEDMPYNRMIINKMLSKYDVNLVEVENGLLAVETWNKNRNFDLILMDMNMPIMDGFRATEEIRSIETVENLKRTPILALTALAMRGDKEKCLEAGCDEYLPKPIDFASFLNICSELLVKDKSDERSQNKQHMIKLVKVLFKGTNIVYQALLKKTLTNLGAELVFVNTENDLLAHLSEDNYDLIILDPESDLTLAYYIKKLYPQQLCVFIVTNEFKGKLLYQEELENLKFPFSPNDVFKILETYSIKIQSRRKAAEELKDVHSLESVKSHRKLEESIIKSDGQVAVWQKSFRKIGGDLILSHKFNYHGRFGLVLADVAGHDIKSGYTASWFSGLVEGVWGQNSNPADLMRYLNRIFDHNTEEEDKRYVCALALLWDRVRNKLYYANTGIPGGILMRKDQENSEQLIWKGLPIGLFDDVELFDHGSIDFFPGDRLYIATDGVLEAIPNEVFQTISNEQSGQPVKEALDSIVDFITRSIKVTDDLTIAAFEAKQLPLIDEGFRTSIQSTMENVTQLITRTERFLKDRHPGKFDWSKVSIAYREALINAIEHGNKNQSHLPVDVDVDVETNRLIITISDTGCGFDLPSVKNKLKKEGKLRIHGRGVEMIENIAKSISFMGGGIKMEFTAQK